MSSWQQLNNKSKNPKFDAFAMDDKRRSKKNGNVSLQRRVQFKKLAWPMAERQIGHRKSCLILSVRFPVVNWRSRPDAKSACHLSAKTPLDVHLLKIIGTNKNWDCSHKIRQGTQETTGPRKLCVLLAWGLVTIIQTGLNNLVSHLSQ